MIRDHDAHIHFHVSRRWKKKDGYVEQAGSRRNEEGDWFRGGRKGGTGRVI